MICLFSIDLLTEFLFYFLLPKLQPGDYIVEKISNKAPPNQHKVQSSKLGCRVEKEKF